MAAKLYQFLGSPFCAKARKLLAFKGVEFEVIEVDYLERKELLIASGQITVPAVTLDNGETIVDSARIAMRLEELYPEPTIFPAGWRGMHVVLADYIDNHLEEIGVSRRAGRRACLLQPAGCGSRRVVAIHSGAQVRQRLRRSNYRGAFGQLGALSQRTRAVRGATRQRAVSYWQDWAGGFRALWPVVLPGVYGRAEDSCRDEEFARVFWAGRSDHVGGRTND